MSSELFRFVVTLVLLTLASSLAYVGLALVLADLTEDYSYMQQCAIGSYWEVGSTWCIG